MEVDTKDLFEFRCSGKEIILQYTTEEAAWKAYYKTSKKITDAVKVPIFE